MTPVKQPVTRILVGLGAAVFLGIVAAWGQTYSHARVVRLSFVEGNVTVQRPDIEDWAEAPTNTPIQEGFKLSTAESSFAEVEFENGSTVRLGQLSLLEFTQLALGSDGSKINCLTMQNGYATYHAAPEGQDVYEVRTPNATLTPRGKARFRVDVDSSGERVEVFNGSLEAASSLGSWTLAKDSVLELSPGTDQPAQLSEGITEDDWDRWVEERESRVEAAQNGPSPSAYSNNGSDASYGWSDLSYYGNWSYIQGFGYGWMPNVYAGWYPYSFGRWSWYPSFGYTWISRDPWGWLPYHYGGWNFVPGIGWVWFPGSFGVWCPALVTWYRGPGWVGWMPRSGLPRTGITNPCSQGQPCGTAISTRTLQTGRPVRPETILAVNLASGRKVEQPDILPDREARLPGRVVPPPAGFANTRPVLQGAGGAAVGSQTKTRAQMSAAPSAGAGPGGAAARPAVGSFTPHVAPGPRNGIVYDPASGLYVNDPRPPSGATQATSELSARPPSSGPEAAGLQTVQPSSGTPQTAGPAPAPQNQTLGLFHHSAPRSDSGSSPTPRNRVAPAGGRATSGSAPRAGGATSGAPKSGGGSKAGPSTGGGVGGGAHGGGGSGSGGGHR